MLLFGEAKKFTWLIWRVGSFFVSTIKPNWLDHYYNNSNNNNNNNCHVWGDSVSAFDVETAFKSGTQTGVATRDIDNNNNNSNNNNNNKNIYFPVKNNFFDIP